MDMTGSSDRKEFTDVLKSFQYRSCAASKKINVARILKRANDAKNARSDSCFFVLCYWLWSEWFAISIVRLPLQRLQSPVLHLLFFQSWEHARKVSR
jgi:hypothetical protein